MFASVTSTHNSQIYFCLVCYFHFVLNIYIESWHNVWSSKFISVAFNKWLALLACYNKTLSGARDATSSALFIGSLPCMWARAVHKQAKVLGACAGQADVICGPTLTSWLDHVCKQAHYASPNTLHTKFTGSPELYENL